MYCTQCGTKIEDGYKFCSGCGAPVEQGAPAEADTSLKAEGFVDVAAREMFLKYPTNKSKAIKKLSNKIHVTPSEAVNIMDLQYSAPENQRIIEEYRQAEEEMSNKISECIDSAMYKRDMKKASRRAEKRQVHCPRCKSTSISYGQKPSFGRALVGYGVAGEAGAVIGSMTGRKGYAVCLKCGKTWKV